MLKTLAPSATDVIRADHARVMAAFHRYSIDAPPARKRALVNTICAALQAHAQAEEEIFYPAVRSLGDARIDELITEHAKMRELIATLDTADQDSRRYDEVFMDLMHEVIHHVADEETRVLPEAERALATQLNELGARMVKRRFELLGPRAGDIVRDKARAMPKTSLAAGALALVAGGFLARKALQRLGKAH